MSFRIYWFGAEQLTSRFPNNWWPRWKRYICVSRPQWIKCHSEYLYRKTIIFLLKVTTRVHRVTEHRTAVLVTSVPMLTWHDHRPNKYRNHKFDGKYLTLPLCHGYQLVCRYPCIISSSACKLLIRVWGIIVFEIVCNQVEHLVYSSVCEEFVPSGD